MGQIISFTAFHPVALLAYERVFQADKKKGIIPEVDFANRVERRLD